MLKYFLILFFCFSTAYSQIIEKQSLLMGYNAHMSDAPKWQQKNFDQALSKLQPNTLRYPGGSNSFYWDWKKGWTLSYRELLPYLVKSNFLVDGQTIKTEQEFKELTKSNRQKNPFWRQVYRYNAKIPRYDKITDFAYAIKSQNAKAVFTLNLITSTVENEIDMLKEAQKNNIKIEYIELGNEINSENLITKHFYPDAKTYTDTCVIWAKKLLKEFPEIKIGVVGGNKNKRMAQWNQTLAKAINQYFPTQKDQFFFVLHYYPHFKTPVFDFNNWEDYKKLIAFPKMDLKQRLKWWQWEATNEFDTWVTEYNVIEPKPYSINNKWMHALFTSNLISEIINQTDPKMLHYHSIGSKKFPVFAAIDMMNNKMEISSSGLATSLWNRLSSDSYHLKNEKSDMKIWKVDYPSKFSCECPNNPKLATTVELNPLQIFSSTKNGLKNILITNLGQNNTTINLSRFNVANAKVEKYFAELKDEKWSSEVETSNGEILIPPFSMLYINEIKND
jgi:hypothetical protein